MADRSIFKKNLKYHRIVLACIVLISIWLQYLFRDSEGLNYENGQTKIVGENVNGKDEGSWTWYYENGKKQMQGTFLHGKRDGLWVLLDTNGNKLSESNYKNDKLNGKFTRWYSNGKTESEGMYVDDTISTVVYYNPDGTLKVGK